MKLLVASVGRPRDRRLMELHDDWAERIRRLGVAYETRWVPETKSGGRFSDDHVRVRETRVLASAVDGPGCTIALDPTGRMFSSEQLADRLQTWAVPRAKFVIGGPLGLDPEWTPEAEVVLSLSPMTFPHELTRAVLAEQLYRAVTILRRVPYHKGGGSG